MNGFVDEKKVFHLEIPVLETDADVFEHANNTRYIGWMQEIAIAHSVFYGWDDQRYLDYGGGWFVRRHIVDYIHPVYPGETLLGETWVESMKHVSCVRKYRFTRKQDGRLISNAETCWAFVSFKTGKPFRVPEEIRRLFVDEAPRE